MLGTLGMNRTRRTFRCYATFTVVTLTGVAFMGLGKASAWAQSTPAAPEHQAPVDALGLELVPSDAIYYLYVRPAETASRDEFQKLTQHFDQLTHALSESQVSLRDVREVLVTGTSMTRTRVVFRMMKAGDHLKLFSRDIQHGAVTKLEEPGEWQIEDHGIVREIDTSTLVADLNFTTPAEVLRIPLVNQPPRWAEALQEPHNQSLSFAVDVQACLKVVAPGLQPGAVHGPIPVHAIAPLLETNWIVGHIDLTDRLDLSITFQCKADESAEQLQATLKALAVLLQNALRSQARSYEHQSLRTGVTPAHLESAIATKILEGANQLVADATFAVDGKQVRLSLQSQLTTPEIAALATAMLPAVEDTQQKARRVQATNRFKQLALAMHNYHDHRGHLPPAISTSYRKNGEEHTSEHPHSWRVAILPYLERQNLYNQYRFDEPWDSEANKKVLAQMPDLFRSSHDEPKSTNTSAFVLTGPEALFDGEEKTRFREVTDGLSRTILIVEAKRDVPWTKPEDIPYAADKPVPKLGGWVPGEFVAALADGSVHRVSTDIEESTLRAYITKAGGEQAPELPKPSDAE